MQSDIDIINGSLKQKNIKKTILTVELALILHPKIPIFSD